MTVGLDTTLSTQRLCLKAVDYSEVDLIWDASRRVGFTDGMTWDPPASREEIVEITRRTIASWQQGTDYVFTIFLPTGVAIGRVGFHQQTDPNTWNLGFWIRAEHWGKGYAAEAARAVLDFGFTVLKAEKCVTSHAVWNTQSQSVIKRLGFELTGENPVGFFKKGKPVAEYEYELRR